MLLRFDGQQVGAAAEHTRSSAAACRDLAGAIRGTGQVSDPDVQHGLTDVVEVCADAFELVALDLGLLAARVHAGARLYDAVEQAVTAASDAGP